MRILQSYLGKKEEEHDFQPPLDIVDGAARVMDPLFDGINTGKHWSGKFFKRLHANRLVIKYIDYAFK